MACQYLKHYKSCHLKPKTCCTAIGFWSSCLKFNPGIYVLHWLISPELQLGSCQAVCCFVASATLFSEVALEDALTGITSLPGVYWFYTATFLQNIAQQDCSQVSFKVNMPARSTCNWCVVRNCSESDWSESHQRLHCQRLYSLPENLWDWVVSQLRRGFEISLAFYFSRIFV